MAELPGPGMPQGCLQLLGARLDLGTVREMLGASLAPTIPAAFPRLRGRSLG